jgi:hypothetical protein
MSVTDVAPESQVCRFLVAVGTCETFRRGRLPRPISSSPTRVMRTGRDVVDYSVPRDAIGRRVHVTAWTQSVGVEHGAGPVGYRPSIRCARHQTISDPGHVAAVACRAAAADRQRFPEAGGTEVEQRGRSSITARGVLERSEWPDAGLRVA